MTEIKLTPRLRAMLERIQRATDSNGSLMLFTITAAGGREGSKLQKLRNLGWVEYCDHQLPRTLVDGVRITDAGRAAMEKEAGG
jgi:hypothetical protein